MSLPYTILYTKICTSHTNRYFILVPIQHNVRSIIHERTHVLIYIYSIHYTLYKTTHTNAHIYVYKVIKRKYICIQYIYTYTVYTTHLIFSSMAALSGTGICNKTNKFS